MASSEHRDRAAPDAEPPVIVVEGDERAFEAATDELRHAGWRVVPGFAEGSGTAAADGAEVRVGSVSSAADAAAALLVVLAGSGVVIHVRVEGEVLDRLHDDLRHVARVDVRRGSPGAIPPSLDADSVAILAILAEGRTLGDAAATLGLSRRTADRRLAEARRLLGVERTVEAVSRARRLGWLA